MGPSTSLRIKLSAVAIKAAKGRAKQYKLTDSDGLICSFCQAAGATGG